MGIVSAELATHDYTQTYEIGIPCHCPSPARSHCLGYSQEYSDSSALDKYFLNFICGYGVGVDYYILMDKILHNTLYSSLLPYDFAVLPIKEAEFISLDLDDGCSHMSCFHQWNIGLCYTTKTFTVESQSFLLPYTYAITIRTCTG